MSRYVIAGTVVLCLLVGAQAAEAGRPAALRNVRWLLGDFYEGRSAAVLGKRTIGARTIIFYTETGGFPEDHGSRRHTILGAADASTGALLGGWYIGGRWNVDDPTDPDCLIGEPCDYVPPRVVGEYSYRVTFKDLDGDGADEIVFTRKTAKERTGRERTEAAQLDRRYPRESIAQWRHGRWVEVERWEALCPRLPGDEPEDAAAAALDAAPDDHARACVIADLFLPLSAEYFDKDPWISDFEKGSSSGPPANGPITIAPHEIACPAAAWSARHQKAFPENRVVVYVGDSHELISFGTQRGAHELVDEVKNVTYRVVGQRLLMIAEDTGGIVSVFDSRGVSLLVLSGVDGDWKVVDVDGTFELVRGDEHHRYLPATGRFS